MNKKIVPIVLAFTMLLQSAASSLSLKEYVNGKSNYADYLVNQEFSYTKFNQELNQIPEKVTPEVISTVSTANAGTYNQHTTANPLYGTNFDFMVELEMQPVKDAFGNLYTIGHNLVLGSETTNRAELQTRFVNSRITGNFTVNVTYSPALSPSSSNVVLKQFDGTNWVEPRNFELDTVTPGTGTMEVKFNVKDDASDNPLTIGDINSDLTRLNNLAVVIEDVTATVPNTVLTVETTMDGVTYFADLADYNNPTTNDLDYTRYGYIEYDSDDTNNLSAVYYYAGSSPSPGSGGGGVTGGPKAYTVVGDTKTEIPVNRKDLKYSVDLNAVETPVKEGYRFDGWYLDEAMTQPASGVVEIIRTSYFYGKFVEDDTDKEPAAYIVIAGKETEIPLTDKDSKKYIDINSIEKPTRNGFSFAGWYDSPYFTNELSGEIEITEPTYIYAKFVNITPPEEMISDDHILYIVGYPDGEVKPNDKITREEVVAALYRLLKPEYRESIESTESFFPDVESERWSFNEISTMYSGGFIAGYDDGTFNPGNPITRAEFVTIIRNFAPFDVEPYAFFSDIEGHWAKDYILEATSLSWITGYEDGTFRPNNYITRAEAMTIINGILVRYADVDSDLAMQWPDLDKSDWYYGPVIEATTAHQFEREADGWNEAWLAEGFENSALTNDPFYLDLLNGSAE